MLAIRDSCAYVAYWEWGRSVISAKRLSRCIMVSFGLKTCNASSVYSVERANMGRYC